MAYKKASELLISIQKDIGLVSGTAVQTYSEPQIYRGLQLMFDMMFRKRFWDHLTDWYELTLDGVNGLFSTDINNTCAGFEDIEQIWTRDFSRQIVKPFDTSYKQVTGASALYYTPIVYDADDASNKFAKKVIQFWPVTATDVVAVRMRKKPADFVPDDVVPFPSDIISIGTAWRVLSMDGINPAAAQSAEKMYEILYSDYIANLGTDEIGYGSGRLNVPLTIRTL